MADTAPAPTISARQCVPWTHAETCPYPEGCRCGAQDYNALLRAWAGQVDARMQLEAERDAAREEASVLRRRVAQLQAVVEQPAVRRAMVGTAIARQVESMERLGREIRAFTADLQDALDAEQRDTTRPKDEEQDDG